MLCYFSTKCQRSVFFVLFAKTTCLVLELWSKNLKTNQNVEFSKSQYLTKNLATSSGCTQARLNMSKVTTNGNQLYLKNELSYEVRFLHVFAIEVTLSIISSGSGETCPN